MILRVTGLFIYPVKGARGISLQEAQLTSRGLAHDRRFMIVDKDGFFLTQRTHPQLARLETTLRDHTLQLHNADVGTLRLPIAPSEGQTHEVEVWRVRVPALDVGDQAAQFCTELMRQPARLVYMPDSTHRQVKREYAEEGDLVSFADGFPYLLVNESSLADLNAQLEQPVPMDRFRPNVVVAGAAPWAEDSWTGVTIGTSQFEVRKPCDRCVVITTDQRTGERNGKEPLKTLASYHPWHGKAAFGQNVLCREHGTGWLRVGDEARAS